MSQKGPHVIVPQKQKLRLAARWKQALIVKLLGRMIKHESMDARLHKTWTRDGEREVIDVGAGYFMVNFDNETDYELTNPNWRFLITLRPLFSRAALEGGFCCFGRKDY
ncbi:hypothetical protein K1719_002253 [Acacia pycnantha]|nr:hypothetical protein K1719_002253 [Acacia pycnantha]